MEELVRATANAPWLPAGGRAEVLRTGTPPHPMCLVRLLLRRGDEVFCVPRDDTGRLDLPTRVVASGDPAGMTAVAELAREILGKEAPLRFVGAVRNVVESAAPAYDWPVPLAHFGVWTADCPPTAAGDWLALFGEGSVLCDRHWHPLVR